MSGPASSASISIAASSRKRASSPATAQSADAAAALQPQPLLHSPIAPSPQKRACKNLLQVYAFRGDAHARASAGAAAPIARRWSELSPAQRCFSDGLALAFSFLSLAELTRAAAVCKAWLMAAKKANIAPVTLSDPPIGSASNLLRTRLVASPFRRHVHAITHNAASWFRSTETTAWTIRGLAELAKLPQLRRISGLMISITSAERPKSAGTGNAVFSFPPLLESVDLHFQLNKPLRGASASAGHNSSGAAQGCVLRALRPCHSLTELSITLRDSIKLVLDGLLEITGLQTLTIDIQPAGLDNYKLSLFTEAQIGVVKRLSSLRRLALLDCSYNEQAGDRPLAAWLRWLCSPPHRLQQLEQLDLNDYSLGLEHMQLLQRLPALTVLEPEAVCLSALPLLPAFAAHLRILHLRVYIAGIVEVGPELWDFQTDNARAPLFLPHLIPCTALRQLKLSRCVFTEAEAIALCHALPLLQKLGLDRVSWPSIESLRHLPLLGSFSLQRSRGHPLCMKAEHFEPLQQLRSLTLIDVHPHPDSDTIAALRPPSALLPALAEFRFTPQ